MSSRRAQCLQISLLVAFASLARAGHSPRTGERGSGGERIVVAAEFTLRLATDRQWLAARAARLGGPLLSAPARAHCEGALYSPWARGRLLCAARRVAHSARAYRCERKWQSGRNERHCARHVVNGDKAANSIELPSGAPGRRTCRARRTQGVAGAVMRFAWKRAADERHVGRRHCGRFVGRAGNDAAYRSTMRPPAPHCAPAAAGPVFLAPVGATFSSKCRLCLGRRCDCGATRNAAPVFAQRTCSAWPSAATMPRNTLPAPCDQPALITLLIDNCRCAHSPRASCVRAL